MKKAKMHTPNLTQENIARIRELFPNCVTEIKDPEAKPDAEVTVKYAIDFDLLKQELSGQIVEGPVERYQLNWPGKREALLAANAPIAKTLRPVREESVNFDTTENLFIEGDNLDALKLLQETYLGKVKMIYIDPPYNTGSDFIYNDDFAENSDEYLVRSNQKDEEGNRLIANSESNGRFHSDWLSMMYPRLKLARNLLSDDGVIFISIDDGEVHNLRKVCDEIFGEGNFVTTIHVQLSTVQGQKVKSAKSGNIVKNAEYLLVYSKNGRKDIGLHPLFDPAAYDNHYSLFLTTNEDGSFSEQSLNDIIKAKAELLKELELLGLVTDRGAVDLKEAYSCSPLFRKFIRENSSCIARVHDTVPISSALMSTFQAGRVYRIEIGGREYLVSRSGDSCSQRILLRDKMQQAHDFYNSYGPTTIRGDWWAGYYLDMGNISKEGDVVFRNGKKPVRLLQHIVEFITQGNDLIMDFFAGSASLAEAVFKQNIVDGSCRKFILIQLDEPLSKGIESQKDAFRFCADNGFSPNVANIAKERIRRAGKKIQEELNTKDAPAPKKKKKADAGDLFDAGVVEDGTDPEAAGKDSASRELDIGFRVLKVDTSCMADVYYTPDQTNQDQLTGLVENIKQDRTEEDLLFQVLLDWGVDLTLPIVREKIEKLDVFFVDRDSLAACFAKDGKITERLVEQIAERSPMRVVFRDAGFKSDSVRINVEQIFKQKSPETEIRTI